MTINVTLGYQPNGYEPLKMNVDLLLEPSAGESVEGMVQTIQLLFKPPGQTAAIPLPVVNSQAAACGLNLVYFKGIDLSKKTENSYGEAALEFWECLPVTVQTKAAGSGKKRILRQQGRDVTGPGNQYRLPGIPEHTERPGPQD